MRLSAAGELRQEWGSDGDQGLRTLDHELPYLEVGFGLALRGHLALVNKRGDSRSVRRHQPPQFLFGGR